MKRKLNMFLFYLLTVIIVIYSIFPLYYAIVSSFKKGSDLFRVDYFPLSIDWSNYWSVFTQLPFGSNILNSVIVATSVVCISILLGITASYSLGRVKFKGRGLILLSILSVSMFPQIAVLSGLFELISALGLYNNITALILAYMIFTLPFTVWILTVFIKQLPVEIEEAAIVDGASPWAIVFRIFLPLMWPAFVSTGLLAFIAAWNEFLFALTFTLTDHERTVPVAIALISGASQYELPWGNIMAASVIVTLPLIILVLVFQKRIVSGLTAGSIKG